MEKLKHIQKVVEDYFVKNPSVSLIPAKDMMPYFIKANIFVQDQKKRIAYQENIKSA